MKENEVRFKTDCILVSKTDTKGQIIYANEAFIAISGYSEKDLLGKPHKIIRHEKMPRIIFKLLWEYIGSGEEMNAYFINKTKQGRFYWVYANITGSKDNNGNLIGYHSSRTEPRVEALEVIIPLYEKLLSLEQSSGIDASKAYLNKLLSEKGTRYEEYVLSI